MSTCTSCLLIRRRDRGEAPEDLAYRVMRRLGVTLSERCAEADMNRLALALRERLKSLRQPQDGSDGISGGVHD